MPAEGDAGRLRAALAAEHATIYGYGVVGAYLRGDDREFARKAWNAHRARRDRLRRRITERGGSPVPAAAGYQLPFTVDGPRTATRLAARLEEGAVEAYIGLVAADDPRLRRIATQSMQDYAAQAARWRGSAAAFPGLPPRAIYQTPSSPTPSG